MLPLVKGSGWVTHKRSKPVRKAVMSSGQSGHGIKGDLVHQPRACSLRGFVRWSTAGISHRCGARRGSPRSRICGTVAAKRLSPAVRDRSSDTEYQAAWEAPLAVVAAAAGAPLQMSGGVAEVWSSLLIHFPHPDSISDIQHRW